MKKQPKNVVQKVLSANLPICISSITLSELEYGISKSQKPKQNSENLIRFLSNIDILAYDSLAAEKFGTIRTYLEKKGQIIGAYDLLIAAHALATKSVLITNNEKEFKRVPSLKIENWAT